MGNPTHRYFRPVYLKDLMYKNNLSLNISVNLNLSWKYINYESVSIIDVI